MTTATGHVTPRPPRRISRAPSPGSNGGHQAAIVESVLDLLADAIWADVVDRFRRDGSFPQGNRP